MGFLEFNGTSAEGPKKTPPPKPEISAEDSDAEENSDPVFVHESNLAEEKFKAKESQFMFQELSALLEKGTITKEEQAELAGYIGTPREHIVENLLRRKKLEKLN